MDHTDLTCINDNKTGNIIVCNISLDSYDHTLSTPLLRLMLMIVVLCCSKTKHEVPKLNLDPENISSRT